MLDAGHRQPDAGIRCRAIEISQTPAVAQERRRPRADVLRKLVRRLVRRPRPAPLAGPSLEGFEAVADQLLRRRPLGQAGGERVGI